MREARQAVPREDGLRTAGHEPWTTDDGQLPAAQSAIGRPDRLPVPFQLSRPSRAAWEGLAVRVATVSAFLTVGLGERKKPTVNYPARRDELTVATTTSARRYTKTRTKSSFRCP